MNKYTSKQKLNKRNKYYSTALWSCWLGGRKGIRPVKTEWWGAGVVISLERGADLHMAQLVPLPLIVSCVNKIQIGFAFLVPAHPSSPGQRPLNGCVCVYVCHRQRLNSLIASISFSSVPGLLWGAFVWSTFSCFDRTPICDRQTDEQTDIVRQTGGHSRWRWYPFIGKTTNGKRKCWKRKKEITKKRLIHWS